MQESIVFLLRVQCRRKETSRSLSHLLMSFLCYNARVSQTERWNSHQGAAVHAAACNTVKFVSSNKAVQRRRDNAASFAVATYSNVSVRLSV